MRKKLSRGVKFVKFSELTFENRSLTTGQLRKTALYLTPQAI